MSYLLDHWSVDPLMLCALVVAVWHELGLRRLLRRTRRDRVRRRRLRSLWFYAGLGVLAIAVASPLEHWGYDYFLIHTVQHLLLMFAAPTLIVAGAPSQPLLVALPLRARRAGLRALLHERWARPLRAAGRLLVRPAVIVTAFNLVMVGWEIPGALDLAERNRFVHVWLMNGSMLLTGVLFWLLIIPSAPLRMRIAPAGQAVALLATNFVMWALALSLTLFTHHSWYSVYSHIPGVTLSPFADQQLGAGLLWVCGDLWAVPALIIALRRLIAEEAGVVDAALERLLGQRSSSQVGRARP
ncbi:MAG TPA: cytochrome c oxidase assembly protein [Solirubrobacteraceae bacterium]|nr:cytochrome c oxidase assembly protein [Solirubrobacteraceae bacterium]